MASPESSQSLDVGAPLEREDVRERAGDAADDGDGRASTGGESEGPAKASMVQRVASLVFGLALALIVGEIAVRIMAAQSLVYSIEMVRYAKELKVADPRGELIYMHRPNASAHLMGVDIALNELGHRGPALAAKSPDRKRVLVLGSSVTMGWGVPFGETFTSLAERRFNEELPLGPSTHIEISNAGIANYNTLAQSRLFARQYPELKPDLVVLHYFISDPEPRPPGKNNFVLRQSYFAAYCYDRFRSLGFAAGSKNDLFNHYSEVYDDQLPYWRDALAKISEMRDAAAKDGVPFVVMIIPDFHNLRQGTPYGAIYEKIARGFAEQHIRVINTFPVFQEKHGGNEAALWIQPDDPHPNRLGHALMADLLYKELAEPRAFVVDGIAAAGPAR